MRGRSFAITRSDVIYLPTKPLKREKVKMVHNRQHLTQLVKQKRERLGPLVLRQPKAKPVEGKGFCEFERVWNVRQEDLSRRERLTKMGLLDRLLAKTEPLPEYEECLKKKLINELFST